MALTKKKLKFCSHLNILIKAGISVCEKHYLVIANCYLFFCVGNRIFVRFFFFFSGQLSET